MIIQLFQHHSFSISLFSYWFDMPFSSFTKVLNFLMFHWIFLSSLYQHHNGMDTSVYSSMSIFFLSTIDSLFFIGIWKWTCLFIDLGEIGIFLYLLSRTLYTIPFLQVIFMSLRSIFLKFSSERSCTFLMKFIPNYFIFCSCFKCSISSNWLLFKYINVVWLFILILYPTPYWTFQRCFQGIRFFGYISSAK